MAENKLRNDIIVAILTAFLTVAFGLFAWKMQFQDTNSQALFEHKLTAVEKFTKDASTMAYYLRFMDKVHFKIAVEQSKLIPKSIRDPLDPFNDIKINKDLINENVTFALMETVKNKDTSTFRLYQRANDFISQYFSTYWSTTNFFKCSTINKMHDLDSMLNPEFYQKIVKDYLKLKKGKMDILTIGEGEIIDTPIYRKRKEQLNKVITSMKKEIEDQDPLLSHNHN